MDLAKHIKPLTGESDWPIWKRKIRDLLDYHEGALDVIDRQLLKPLPLSDTATEIEKKKHKDLCDLYRKANSYAKSMITSSVSDSVYEKIMDKESASDAWDALKGYFEATSRDQLFKICTEFFAFSWTDGEDVSTHIAKVKALWNELNSGLTAKNESALPDLMLVCKVLHILPFVFETFKSSWMLLTKDENRTFEELTSQLCMFERNFVKTADTKLKVLLRPDIKEVSTVGCQIDIKTAVFYLVVKNIVQVSVDLFIDVPVMFIKSSGPAFISKFYEAMNLKEDTKSRHFKPNIQIYRPGSGPLKKTSHSEYGVPNADKEESSSNTATLVTVNNTNVNITKSDVVQEDQKYRTRNKTQDPSRNESKRFNEMVNETANMKISDDVNRNKHSLSFESRRRSKKPETFYTPRQAQASGEVTNRVTENSNKSENSSKSKQAVFTKKSNAPDTDQSVLVFNSITVQNHATNQVHENWDEEVPEKSVNNDRSNNQGDVLDKRGDDKGRNFEIRQWKDKDRIDENESFTSRDKNRRYASRDRNESFTTRDKNESYVPRDKSGGFLSRDRNDDYAARDKNDFYAPRDKSETYVSSENMNKGNKNSYDSWRSESPSLFNRRPDFRHGSEPRSLPPDLNRTRDSRSVEPSDRRNLEKPPSGRRGSLKDGNSKPYHQCYESLPPPRLQKKYSPMVQTMPTPNIPEKVNLEEKSSVEDSWDGNSLTFQGNKPQQPIVHYVPVVQEWTHTYPNRGRGRLKPHEIELERMVAAAARYSHIVGHSNISSGTVMTTPTVIEQNPTNLNLVHNISPSPSAQNIAALSVPHLVNIGGNQNLLKTEQNTTIKKRYQKTRNVTHYCGCLSTVYKRMARAKLIEVTSCFTKPFSILPTTEERMTIVEKITLDPSEIVLPWDPAVRPKYEIKLEAKGGDGNFVWSSGDTSTAIMTQLGKLTTPSHGTVNYVVSMARNPYNKEVCIVYIVPPTRLEIVNYMMEAPLLEPIYIQVALYAEISNRKLPSSVEKRMVYMCNDIPFRVEVWDSDFIYNSSSEFFSKACATLAFVGRKVGSSKVTISYTRDGDYTMEDSVIVATYNPLNCLHPKSRSIVLALGTSRIRAFQGGPRPRSGHLPENMYLSASEYSSFNSNSKSEDNIHTLFVDSIDIRVFEGVFIQITVTFASYEDFGMKQRISIAVMMNMNVLTELEAKQKATALALKYLKELYSCFGTTGVSARNMMYNIVKIVSNYQTGTRHNNIAIRYHKTYGDVLPVNWLTIVRGYPYLVFQDVSPGKNDK